MDSVFAFAYRGVHAEALRRRKEWFHKPQRPTYAAWWTPDEHLPTWAEAVERQERLHAQGPTPFAFDFRNPFDPEGNPLALRRPEPENGVSEGVGQKE